MLDLGAGSLAPRPPAAERFLGSSSSLVEAYENKMGDVDRLLNDPTELIARATASFQPLAEAGHPELAAKLTTRMMVGLQYLKANAPPTMGQCMWAPEGSQPDEIAVLQFAPIWEAVWRPLDTVQDIGARVATPSAVRALREVHPDLYGKVMAEAFRTLSAAGPTVDFETKRYLDNVFGFGPALGRSFSPGTKATLASEPTKPQSAGPSPAPRSATSAFSKGPSSPQ
jgi:hypothetical protein